MLDHIFIDDNYFQRKYSKYDKASNMESNNKVFKILAQKISRMSTNQVDDIVRSGGRIYGKKNGYSVVIALIVVYKIDDIKSSVKDICREA